jgi:hypothetical protein
LTVFGHSGNWIVIQSDTMLRPKCRGQVAATVFRQDRLQNVKTLRTAFCQSANRYTRLENLAWSHSFFWQLVFCKKRRFTKPLLLSRVDTFGSFTKNIECFPYPISPAPNFNLPCFWFFSY